MKDNSTSLISDIRRIIFLHRQRFVTVILLSILLGALLLVVLAAFPQMLGGMIYVERVNSSTTPTTTPDGPHLHDSPNLGWENGSDSSDLPNATRIERRIYTYINAERIAYEQEPYIYNPELAQVARNWSRWRASRKGYAHFTDEGVGPWDRIKRAGYECDGNHLGENAHAFQSMQSTISPNKTNIYLGSSNSIARHSIQRFMKSSGHRWGILSPNFDVVGVGVYVTANNTVYVTHLFCERKDSFDQAVNARTTDKFTVAMSDKRAIGNESHYEGLPEAPEMPEKPPELSLNATDTVTNEN